jgi:DNA-binding response OmpR family regulator
MMKKKFLIVEDDVVFCKILTRFLEKNAFEVNDAQSASSAIEKLEENTFDLVILDYQLQDSNGMEVLKWINQNKPGTKVFMLTRYLDEQVISEATALGAIDYLPKPIKPRDLLEKIEAVMTA